MIKRYTRKEMGELWSLQNEFQTMLNVEIAACEAMAELGEIPKEALKNIKEKYPNHIVMGDISNVDEAVYSEKIGVDIVGTTLCGYTDYTKGDNPLNTLQEVLKAVKIPVIAEGNLDTPEKAKKSIQMGALAVVVGGAITRPKQIAEKFIKAIESI